MDRTNGMSMRIEICHKIEPLAFCLSRSLKIIDSVIDSDRSCTMTLYSSCGLFSTISEMKGDFDKKKRKCLRKSFHGQGRVYTLFSGEGVFFLLSRACL